MKSHRAGNFVGSIILAFGVLYALQLKGLSLGTRDTPGSALLPTLLCLALFLFVCIDLLKGATGERLEDGDRVELPEKNLKVATESIGGKRSSWGVQLDTH